MFTGLDHLEDIWTIDLDVCYEDSANRPKESAKQFIEQLEGHWCADFMQELSLQCAKKYFEFCKETKQMHYWDKFIEKINE